MIILVDWVADKIIFFLALTLVLRSHILLIRVYPEWLYIWVWVGRVETQVVAFDEMQSIIDEVSRRFVTPFAMTVNSKQ